jgi:hypothetical protein
MKREGEVDPCTLNETIVKINNTRSGRMRSRMSITSGCSLVPNSESSPILAIKVKTFSSCETPHESGEMRC